MLCKIDLTKFIYRATSIVLNVCHKKGRNYAQIHCDMLLMGKEKKRRMPEGLRQQSGKGSIR